MRNDNIIYIGDLIRKTEREILVLPNAGREMVNEPVETLKSMERMCRIGRRKVSKTWLRASRPSRSE